MRIETKKTLHIDEDEFQSICNQISNRLIESIDCELWKCKSYSIELVEGLGAVVSAAIICDHINHLDYKEITERNVTHLDITLFDSEGDELTCDENLEHKTSEIIETI